ncbi:hypothetical protein GF354_00270 [Candidatus Peregrinibacteria bacterium]|nr:hypothetical protein [Candidatus Peregrinibacteria bacterium]
MVLSDYNEEEDVAVRGDNVVLTNTDAKKLVDAHNTKKRATWFINAFKMLMDKNSGENSYFALADIVMVLCVYLSKELGFQMDASRVKELIEVESIQDEKGLTSGFLTLMGIKLFDFEYHGTGDDTEIMNFDKADTVEALDMFENKILFG